ncbi:MAG TPA: hypothetical protein VG982_02710 [Candidatus Paceibacterota bacterium]|nr:hypothetical protein [Candidatus Paceibacterota bacterium]
MGIKFGEIDSSQILENEFRIGVLEKLLEFLMNNNPNLNRPSQPEIDNIRNSVVELLKKKYPNSGISLEKK